MSTPRPVVLIVDPDRDAREIAQTLLASAGFATVSTGDPAAALAIAPAIHARVIVVELYVCFGDEICVLRTLRRVTAAARSRILVHTVHARAEDREWAMAGGCDAFLSKPSPAAALLAQVRALAGTAAAAVS